MKPGLVLVAAPLALMTCVGPVPSPEAAPAVGLANPASVYCLKQGGTLEMREDTSGTVGYCRLPDGNVIEEWAYFRANNP